MKCLVLGSAGLIGTYLCNELFMYGHEVIRFDVADDPAQDLRIPNNPILEKMLDICDIVYFLAFDVGGYKYLVTNQGKYNYICSNDLLMHNTFKMLDKYKKRFIFISTQMVDMPGSAYGILKRLGESYTSSLGGLHVRLWNVYGIEARSIKSHVITDLIFKGINDKKIELLSKGTESRQFIHAIDCVKALRILGEKYDELNRNLNYHITSFNWKTIGEIAVIISRCLNNIPIIYGLDTAHVPMIQPDNHILSLWNPKIVLEDGIAALVEHYLKNGFKS